MSTIIRVPHSSLDLADVRNAVPAKLERSRTRKRNSGAWKLAAGYRLMAWRALRKGDSSAAAMNAACSRALRGTLPTLGESAHDPIVRRSH